MTPNLIRTELERLAREKLSAAAPVGGDLVDSLDSVQRLTLVVAIEDHFEICFDPEDEERIVSIDDIVSVIHGKLSQP